MLVFSVTPFKIDKNQNQNRSIDKVQNLRKERSIQNSGYSNFSYGRYAEKLFAQIYRDPYGDMVPIWLCTNMAAGKPTGTSVTEFCYKSVNLSLKELKNIKIIFLLILFSSRTVQIAKVPEISHITALSAVM